MEVYPEISDPVVYEQMVLMAEKITELELRVKLLEGENDEQNRF